MTSHSLPNLAPNSSQHKCHAQCKSHQKWRTDQMMDSVAHLFCSVQQDLGVIASHVVSHLFVRWPLDGVGAACSSVHKLGLHPSPRCNIHTTLPLNSCGTFSLVQLLGDFVHDLPTTPVEKCLPLVLDNGSPSEQACHHCTCKLE